MSTTPRTDAARGFHDMDTAVSAEDMAKIETELTRLRAENEDLAIRAGLRLSALDYEKLNAEALKARTEKAEAELAAEREKVRVLRSTLERRHTEQGYHRQYVDDVLDATKEASK
jgi:hypothetical protein